jgi:hypothetical protein
MLEAFFGHGTARQSLGKQSIAGAGRSNQQDVRLRQFDVVVLGLLTEPLL